MIPMAGVVPILKRTSIGVTRDRRGYKEEILSRTPLSGGTTTAYGNVPRYVPPAHENWHPDRTAMQPDWSQERLPRLLEFAKWDEQEAVALPALNVPAPDCRRGRAGFRL